MPARRDQIEMTPEELRAYITTQRVLIVVSNGPRGYPHPMPMFYWVDDRNRFYVSTFRKSQKVVNLQRDPKSATLIETGERYAEFRSALAYTTAEIIDDLEHTIEVMNNIEKKDVAIGYASALSAAERRVTAEKRVIIRFTPHRFITWDHKKLFGIY